LRNSSRTKNSSVS
jgi:hypothetical protein